MRKKILPLLLVLLLLTGCLYRGAAGQEYVEVYYLGETGTLTAKQLPLHGRDRLEMLIEALNGEPGENGLYRALPNGVDIISCNVERGRAKVQMTKGYTELEGIEKTLTDYAVVCSLVGLDEVMAVDIFSSSHLVEGGLTANDVVMADTEFGDCEMIIKLFLPRPDFTALVSCTEKVTLRAGKSYEETVVRLLLEHLDMVPDAARVLSAAVNSGVCVVNLSEELYATEPEGAAAARLVIAAIVNTLTYLPNVSSVVLRVNSRMMTSYGGYSTQWPAYFDETIIAFE